MSKNIIKTIFGCLAVLIGAILIACVLLVGVGVLCPQEKMRQNLLKDMNYFQKQNDLNYLLGEDNLSFAGDFPSDALMVKTCIYDGNESFLKRVFGDYHYVYEGYETDSDMRIILDLNRGWIDDENQIPSYVFHYGRYWHGYQIILKPLLCIFSWRDIVILGLFVQIALFSITLSEVIHKHGIWWGLPLLMLYFLLNPVTIAMSFQYQSLFYITLSGILALDSNFGGLKCENNYIYIFLIIGIMTSFFDFLTYPIVPVGVCAIWYIAMKDDGNWGNVIKRLISIGLSWGCGYGLFWVSKWVITFMVTGENIIANAGRQFTGYIEGAEESLITVIKNNYAPLLKAPYITVMVICLLAVVVYLVRKGIAVDRILIGLPILLIGILPVIWYCFATSHSYLHSYMTHRDSTVTYFAIFMYLIYIARAKANNATEIVHNS